MRIGSLFSGIGGLDLGLEWAGVGHTVWQVERDPFCRAVLARHWPDAEQFDDVTTVGAANLSPVDVICGGFPCQDISYAGRGAGLAGERSRLWYEYVRIIRELRPQYVVVENVSALLTRGLDVVLGTLASLGYDAEWSCVRASDVGARHRRERTFIIAWIPDPDRRGRSQLADAGAARPSPISAANRSPTDTADCRGEQGGVVDDADNARLEGRRVCGQQRADERTAGEAGSAGLGDADGERRDGGEPDAGGGPTSAGAAELDGVRGGGKLADPRRREVQRRRGAGFVACTSGAGQSEVAERQRDGDAALHCGAAAGDVADRDGGGRERERVCWLLDEERAQRGHDADGRCRAEDLGRRGDREQVNQGGKTKPCVGGTTDGISARLDVARPGEAQADWEAPRVTEKKVPYRADRLRALGNAVVPQVGEFVGRRLMEIVARLGHSG